MKVIVGVDSHRAYVPTLALIQQLRLPQPHLTLVHACDTALPFQAVSEPDSHTQAEYSRVVQNLGLTALDSAIDEACSRDLHARSKLVFGKAAACLIQEADKVDAELIAVCATHVGSWGNTYVGSVSRALAVNAHSSVLVTKGEHRFPDTIKAVLAVDHSLFGERCVERLIEMKPRGLRDITLVSAYDVNDQEAAVLEQNLTHLGGDVERWLEENTEARNEWTAKKLRDAGYNVTTKAVQGSAKDVIHNTMQETQADLLIVGSQGHGFVENAQIGSVSLHQVASEPYPILVLRP